MDVVFQIPTKRKGGMVFKVCKCFSNKWPPHASWREIVHTLPFSMFCIEEKNDGKNKQQQKREGRKINVVDLCIHQV
jgi:hypothetical protein